MHIDVDITSQSLALIQNKRLIKKYLISTAKNGTGEEQGSEMTPCGWHIVRAKIGSSNSLNAVFIGRRYTGEYFSTKLKTAEPERDWILTRILWLSGTEVGKNRLGSVDTMRRYIYIHGCPDEDVMGVPGSHGCIKMKNIDILDLYEKVPAGIRVFIHE